MWVVEYPEELFKVVDRNVVKNDWMRSKSSMGHVIVGVGVRWDEELGGFSFKEVLANAEQGSVDEDEEVSTREIILVVSDDGLCCGGGAGFVGEVCNSICSSKRRRHDGRRRERKMGRYSGSKNCSSVCLLSKDCIVIG